MRKLLDQSRRILFFVSDYSHASSNSQIDVRSQHCLAFAQDFSEPHKMASGQGAKSKAAPPSAAASGGSVRCAGQHLAELNQRSAKLGSWNIAVFQPKVEKYSYKDKSTGEQKRGESFKCLLVSVEDPSCYIQARVALRGDNREPLQKAVAKFGGNKCFRISQVEFYPNAAQA